MNELIKIESMTPLEVYSNGGLDSLLNKIAEEYRSMFQDMSTVKGRKEIASCAHSVAKTKVTIETMGKMLTEEWREKTKKVNEEKNRAVKFLEDLKDEIRKPLTDFENNEKQRVSNHKSNISAISGYFSFSLQLEELKDALLKCENTTINESWEEFQTEAEKIKAQTIISIMQRISGLEKAEADRIELDKLRKEAEERAIKEREEYLKNKAAQDATLKAKIESDKIIAEIEAKKVAAEFALAKERLAKKEAEEAIESEKKRRENDINHKEAIREEILKAIDMHENSVSLVCAILNGEIPHIKVIF